MDSYLTVAGFGEAEYIDKKSRFIGRVWPVETEAEALAHLADMRKLHYDATHNVYAYIIREGNISRFSDDGEPGGTSGMPTLNVFRSGDIYNVCCVVTRYFGGILLGSGGLVRAYSNTAKLALDAAGISRMAWWRAIYIDCGYPQYERVRRLLEDFGAVIEDSQFGAAVRVSALVNEEKADELNVSLANVTAGAAKCTSVGGDFRGIRIK